MTQLRSIRTFYDDRHRLVTLDNDVLGIVSQVRDLFDSKITVHLDDVSGDYYFVEHCEDGTDRLIFSTPELDGRVIERLLQGDSRSRGYRDPYEIQEREQDAAQAAIDEEFKEQLREHGEELAFALKKEGLAPRLPLKVAIPRGVKKHAGRKR